MRAVPITKFLAGLAVVLLFVAGNTARGQGFIVIGTEDPVNGFAGFIPGTQIQVASDGESPFRPFGITVDTSDAIDLRAQGNNWTIDTPTVGWTLWAGTGPVNGVWYIAAAAVGKNEPPVPEPIGTWHSPDPWVASVVGEY